MLDITGLYTNHILYTPIHDLVALGDSYPYYGTDVYMGLVRYFISRPHPGSSPTTALLNLYVESVEDNTIDAPCSLFRVYLPEAVRSFSTLTGNDIRELDISGNPVSLILTDVGHYTIDVLTHMDNDIQDSLWAYPPYGQGTYPNSTFILRLDGTLALTTSTSETLNIGDPDYDHRDSQVKTITNNTGMYIPYFKQIWTNYVPATRTVVIDCTEETCQLSLENGFHRAFFKFELPTINGQLRYATFKINAMDADNENKVVFYDIKSTDNSGWTSASDNTTMNTIYSSSTSHLSERVSGVLDSTSIYLFNVYGYDYVNSVDPYYIERNDVKGIEWMYRNDQTSWTMILDCTSLPGSPTSAANLTEVFLGTTGVIGSPHQYQSFKKFYGINSVIDDDSKPKLIIGWRTPVISLDTTSLELTIVEGDTLNNNIITIENIGWGTLSPNISSDSLWLSLDSSSIGPIEQNDSSSINIVYDVTGLSYGDYTGVVTFEDTDAEPTSEALTVVLHVLQNSYIVVDTEYISISLNHGENHIPITIQVWDGTIETETTLNWTASITQIVQDGSGNYGLILDTTSGSSINSSNKTDLDISFNLSNYNVDEYNWEITIVNDDNESDTIIIPFYITINSVGVIKDMECNIDGSSLMDSSLDLVLAPYSPKSSATYSNLII